jgi:hypothetical protein
MTYALVDGDTIESEHGSLPESARRLDTGDWVLGLREYGTVEQQQACGYFEVVDTPRPADTATDTYVRSLELVAGIPTETWTARPWTAEELASKAQVAVETTLRSNPQTHIDVLVASLAALQTLVDTPNATINASPASYVKGVARELMAAERRLVRLFRLSLGVLDSTDGV